MKRHLVLAVAALAMAEIQTLQLGHSPSSPAPLPPRGLDDIPLPFRDNEKVRAAAEKRARRAAKRRKV